MKWNEISLKSFDYFLDCVRYGSYKEAAFFNNVTSSAVHQSIRKIEATLGYSLIDRDVHGISLTPEGKNFYDHLVVAVSLFRTEMAEVNKDKLLYSTFNNLVPQLE